MSRWLDIGRIEDIPPLGARVVRRPEGDIAVFRASDDRIFALDDRCPHRGGPLSQGIVHGARVTCPLHNWVVELGDGTAVLPDEGCVAVYPVRVVEGRVRLLIEAGAREQAACA